MITGNIADYGGGIFNGGGTVTLTKTTVIKNTALTDGGGIYNQPPGAVTLTVSSKVKNNTPNDCVGC